MDVAASVVSLIQFIIASLHVIQKLFSSIREGHDTDDYVSKSAARLLHILQRLEGSMSLSSWQDPALMRTMKTCHADVTRMVQELIRVEFKPSDNSVKKIWKSAKSALKGK
jgi:hypothetical protein